MKLTATEPRPNPQSKVRPPRRKRIGRLMVLIAVFAILLSGEYTYSSSDGYRHHYRRLYVSWKLLTLDMEVKTPLPDFDEKTHPRDPAPRYCLSLWTQFRTSKE